MSVRRYVDVWCDAEDCLNWAHNATAKTAKVARERARTAGWRHVNGKGLLPRAHAAYFERDTSLVDPPATFGGSGKR